MYYDLKIIGLHDCFGSHIRLTFFGCIIVILRRNETLPLSEHFEIEIAMQTNFFEFSAIHNIGKYRKVFFSAWENIEQLKMCFPFVIPAASPHPSDEEFFGEFSPSPECVEQMGNTLLNKTFKSVV